jgi:hypothetical protein
MKQHLRHQVGFQQEGTFDYVPMLKEVDLQERDWLLMCRTGLTQTQLV